MTSRYTFGPASRTGTSPKSPSPQLCCGRTSRESCSRRSDLPSRSDSDESVVRDEEYVDEDDMIHCNCQSVEGPSQELAREGWRAMDRNTRDEAKSEREEEKGEP